MRTHPGADAASYRVMTRLSQQSERRDACRLTGMPLARRMECDECA
ncbi:hypothetical protein [Burkholderia cenocepacia]|nr:hypothetical protein [Burkholderia cenocepacia]